MLKEYTVEEFMEVLTLLSAHLPISDQYDAEFGQKNAWWVKKGLSQREHMVSWFSQQRTNGNKGFTRNTPNGSARRTYARLGCSGALLWMAEALGETAEKVKEAADAACEIQNERKRCGTIRKIIPWTRVVALYECKVQSTELASIKKIALINKEESTKKI